MSKVQVMEIHMEYGKYGNIHYGIPWMSISQMFKGLSLLTDRCLSDYAQYVQKLLYCVSYLITGWLKTNTVKNALITLLLISRVFRYYIPALTNESKEK